MSGSDNSNEITSKILKEVTAIRIHEGRSNENGPVIESLFEPQTPPGNISGGLGRGTVNADILEGPLVDK